MRSFGAVHRSKRVFRNEPTDRQLAWAKQFVHAHKIGDLMEKHTKNATYLCDSGCMQRARFVAHVNGAENVCWRFETMAYSATEKKMPIHVENQRTLEKKTGKRASERISHADALRIRLVDSFKCNKRTVDCFHRCIFVVRCYCWRWFFNHGNSEFSFLLRNCNWACCCFLFCSNSWFSFSFFPRK